MTLVNTETGEIVSRPSYSEVRDSIATAREAGARFFEQIVWQVERRAWEVLGYSDWDAMREAEYADMGVVVPRADRPEIVTRLRRAGLMQREIAETIGVSQQTVSADLNTDSGIDLPPTVETPRGVRPTSYSRTPAPERAPTPLPASDNCERPALTADVHNFIDADISVQSARWQKNFMASVAKCGQIILFDPADIAANAGPELIAEYERLIRDLSNHLARVRGELPARLTAIPGGRK